MSILEPTEAIFPVDEEILNFFGGGEEEDENILFGGGASANSAPSSSLDSSITTVASLLAGSHTGVMEEELEWLSNKDAFPALDTYFGILADNPELLSSKKSPKSVLENSSSSSNSNENVSPVASCCRSLKVPINFPVRARSKRRRSRRREGFGELLSQHLWLGQVNVKNRKELAYPLPPPAVSGSGGGGLGRRCLHCQADKTPQWRAGPLGPKTLCNACGVRFKSGRLLPEYRPANSPTFQSTVHSNSHRKVVEIRKQKHFGTGMMTGGGGMVGNEACG